MIRQAHKYLVGAMSGATLIAIAIVAFVLLVSAQVFHSWPIAALGDSDSGSVSQAQPVQGTATTTASAASSSVGGSPPAGGRRSSAPGHAAARAGLVSPGSVSAEDPGATAGEPGTESEGGSGSEGGGQQTSQGASPSDGAPTSSGSSGGSSGGGSGGSGGSGSGSTTAASTPTGQIAGAVNETVHQVDQTALGGSLEKTGVTELTEGVVNGVVGPESTVGHVVDETVGAVNGLLGGKR